MITQSLISKYRPRNFDEIIGQNHAINFVTTALKKSSLPNCLLLIGDSGVGKTSLGMCLARALNCIQYDLKNMKLCGECAACTCTMRSVGIFQYISCGEVTLTPKDLTVLVRQAQNCSTIYGKCNLFFLDEIHLWYPERQMRLTTFIETIPESTILICATYKEEMLDEAFRERFQQIRMETPTVDDIFCLLKRIAESERVAVSDKKLRRIALDNYGNPRSSVVALERLICMQPPKTGSVK